VEHREEMAILTDEKEAAFSPAAEPGMADKPQRVAKKG
jgi:hypothetical protein